jgi:ABC-type nitrate/sulfonate/bicarbonate transport system substrate-binding protein
MPLKKKHKVIIIIAIVAVALIAYGAVKGSVKETTPSASFGSPLLEKDDTIASSLGVTPTGVAHNKELKVVKTWTKRDCSLAPWLITDKLGYFKEEGIQLLFTGDIQPPQFVPSILSGHNDVGTFHPNAAAVAINGGAKIKGVSRAGVEPDNSLDPTFRHMWWFVNPEKHPNVKSFADLKDIPGTIKFSVISVPNCSDFLANLILDNYGVPRDKIEWVIMPDVQAVQALKQGLTDVGGVHPPFYKGMLDAGQLKIADSQEANLPPEAAGLTYYFFTEEFIKNNPENVRGFTRAMARGQKWINENPEEARIWTEQAIGIPVSANHYYTTNLKIEPQLVNPWIKDLEEQGVIPKGKLTAADLVVHDFEDVTFVAP